MTNVYALHRKQGEADGNIQNFRQQHSAELAWIEAKATSFGFAASLKEALTRYGSLTAGQLAAVRRCIERDKQFEQNKARAAARDNEV